MIENEDHMNLTDDEYELFIIAWNNFWHEKRMDYNNSKGEQ